MGVSTDGQICIGIVFEEDYPFPWNEEEYDEDIDSWWLNVLGYEKPFELYDGEGNYLNEVRPEQSLITKYYEHERKFLEDNPLPVELVNYQSSDSPAFIIAVPGTLVKANRGYPTKIDEGIFNVEKEKVIALIEFCEKYCKVDDWDFPEMSPKCYLSSYWG